MKIITNKQIYYLFWGTFLFYTNPGGIQQAFGVYEFGIGGANLNDILIMMMGGLYFLIPQRKKILSKDYLKISKYLIVFLIYYLLFFGYITPLINNNLKKSFIFNLIKMRWMVYSVSLFFWTYKFYIRSYKIFFRLLIFTSIGVFSLFFIGLIAGKEILPVTQISRGFIEINRNLLLSYGLMPILIPMGIVIIVFKLDIKYKNQLLIGAGMMFIGWLVSLTRRHIFGTVIHYFLATIISNYLHKRQLISFTPVMRIVIPSLFILIAVYFTFPKYIEAGVETVETTIYVIQHGQLQSGQKDERLGFGNNFIRSLFLKSPMLGTGFDIRWRTREGEKEGYEGSDYPFLSALAMTGLVGTLLFLPIYVLLIKAIKKDIRFFRKNKYNYKSFEFFILIVLMIIFIYSLMQYMNWFAFVSNPGSYQFIVFLAMYFAARKVYYSNKISKVKYVK